MKCSIVLASLVALVAAHPLQFRPQAEVVRRDVDPSLIPDFGFSAGVNPDGTGSCDGAVTGADGKPVKVPCTCPPDRASFIANLNANVAAGNCVNNTAVPAPFPTDDSAASQIARINTALVTLQNLQGPGVGCPAASTTLLAQEKAIQAGGSASSTAAAGAAAGKAASTSAAASAPAASGTAAAAGGTASAADVASLAPELGFQSNVNPDGTGSCDGAVTGADGKPVKVPCTCPPDQATYVAALQANVAAGKAINNPSVAVTFPTDSSSASLAARINSALVTLQNLNGSGKGCPAASTTLLAQLKTAQAAA